MLLMMLADAPHYTRKPEPKPDDGLTDEERQLGFFRSLGKKNVSG